MLIVLLALVLFVWGFVGTSIAVNLFDERPLGSTPPQVVGVALVWPLWPFWLALAISAENGRLLGILGVPGVSALCSILNAVVLAPALVWLSRRTGR